MIKIPQKKLANIFDAMPSKNILIVGDIMLDEYIWGTVERISPEAPVPVVVVKEETYRLGGAGNVVRNLSSLNTGVWIFSVIGDDRQGETVFNLLKDDAVNPEGLIKDPSRRTIVKTRVIAHTQQVVRIDKEDREHISEDNRNKLFSAVKEKMDKADAVILSDYGKGLLSIGLIADIIAEAGKYGFLNISFCRDSISACGPFTDGPKSWRPIAGTNSYSVTLFPKSCAIVFIFFLRLMFIL